MDLKKFIRDIPDFPKEGILFKDISPLLKNKTAFRSAIQAMKEKYKKQEIDYVAGIESRGFIIGTPLAIALNKGFIPIRKPNKLPGEVISISYELEYGNNTLEMHKDAIEAGDKVLLIDDLLATGGTTRASVKLIEKLGGQVTGIGFLLELEALAGREQIKGYNVFSLLQD